MNFIAALPILVTGSLAMIVTTAIVEEMYGHLAGHLVALCFIAILTVGMYYTI